MVCTALMIGCAYVPRLQVLASLGYESAPPDPIALFVADEIDMGAGYYGALDFYDMPRLRDLVKSQLAQRTLKVEMREPGKKGFTATVSNPFVVVDDSALAEVIARLGVSEFGYREKRSSGEQTAAYHAIGIVGLALSQGHVGSLLGEARLERLDTRDVVYDFRFGGVSQTTRDRSKGMRQALERAAVDFTDGLLEPEH